MFECRQSDVVPLPRFDGADHQDARTEWQAAEKLASFFRDSRGRKRRFNITSHSQTADHRLIRSARYRQSLTKIARDLVGDANNLIGLVLQQIEPFAEVGDRFPAEPLGTDERQDVVGDQAHHCPATPPRSQLGPVFGQEVRREIEAEEAIAPSSMDDFALRRPRLLQKIDGRIAIAMKLRRVDWDHVEGIVLPTAQFGPYGANHTLYPGLSITLHDRGDIDQQARAFGLKGFPERRKMTPGPCAADGGRVHSEEP